MKKGIISSAKSPRRDCAKRRPPKAYTSPSPLRAKAQKGAKPPPFPVREMSYRVSVTPEQVMEDHKNLLLREKLVRHLIGQRCWSKHAIEEHVVGYVRINREEWISFPILGGKNALYLKLKRPPGVSEKKQVKGKFFPGNSKASLYPLTLFNQESVQLFWTAGEPDTIAARSNGFNAICGTAGEETFDEGWIDTLKKGPDKKEFYCCCDNDDTGEKANEKVCALVAKHCPQWKIYRVRWPEDFPAKGDLTVFLRDYSTTDDPRKELMTLMEPYVPSCPVEAPPEPIDVSQFQPMTSGDLLRVLGLTVKKDDANKLITFQSMLLAYTENDQVNVVQNAPSASGKTYIPLELSQLFPAEDKKIIGYCSPQAFFHDHAEPPPDEETSDKEGAKGKRDQPLTVDLSRKIIIFLDMPHPTLLERLRPLLSHDDKDMQVKITDKSKKGGNRTKTIIIRGYPTVIFCTAGLIVDEQEMTRCFLLSPEMDQEKIRQAIEQRITKESDSAAHAAWLDAQPERMLLKQRILAIKQAGIHEVKIPGAAAVKEKFLQSNPFLKPRHQRDIVRICSLIKSFALLNFIFRKREGNALIADPTDIEEAFTLWESVAPSQELNLPPFIYDLYCAVIISAFHDKNPVRKTNRVFSTQPPIPLTLLDIQKKSLHVQKRMITAWQWRDNIYPMLEAAGLLSDEPDPEDLRKRVYLPLQFPTPKTIVSESRGSAQVPLPNDAHTDTVKIAKDLFDSPSDELPSANYR